MSQGAGTSGLKIEDVASGHYYLGRAPCRLPGIDREPPSLDSRESIGSFPLGSSSIVVIVVAVVVELVV